jgi:hypothetical protein
MDLSPDCAAMLRKVLAINTNKSGGANAFKEALEDLEERHPVLQDEIINAMKVYKANSCGMTKLYFRFLLGSPLEGNRNVGVVGDRGSGGEKEEGGGRGGGGAKSPDDTYISDEYSDYLEAEKATREEHLMSSLTSYVTETCKADASAINGFSALAMNDRHFYYLSPTGMRFRSRVQVAKFLQLSTPPMSPPIISSALPLTVTPKPPTVTPKAPSVTSPPSSTSIAALDRFGAGEMSSFQEAPPSPKATTGSSSSSFDLRKDLQYVQKCLIRLQNDCNSIVNIMATLNERVEAMEEVEVFAPKTEATKSGKRKPEDARVEEEGEDEELVV